MLSRILIAAFVALGAGGVALHLTDDVSGAVQVETRAAHMAAVSARVDAPLVRLVSESCAVTPTPAPVQARVPAAPARQDI